MLISSILQGVKDTYPAGDYSDAELTRWIGAAIRWYSRYNPYMVETTITTVGQQEEYTLPSDCGQVMKVDYWPSGDLGVDLNAVEEIAWPMARQARYDEISLRVIEDIKDVEAAKRLQGAWFMRNKKLCLSPIPTASGTVVPVEYARAHGINAGLTGYDSIPDDDLEIIRDLVVAEIVHSRMVQHSIEPDYVEGLQTVTKRFVPGNARQAIQELRSACIAKYGASVVAAV